MSPYIIIQKCFTIKLSNYNFVQFRDIITITKINKYFLNDNEKQKHCDDLHNNRLNDRDNDHILIFPFASRRIIRTLFCISFNYI